MLFWRGNFKMGISKGGYFRNYGYTPKINMALAFNI